MKISKRFYTNYSQVVPPVYPDDLDVVEGALDKNVRNARDVRNVAMPHFQEAKQEVQYLALHSVGALPEA